MNTENILKLVEEILALAGTAQPKEAEPPKDEPATQPEPEPEPATQPEPEPEPEKPAQPDPNETRYNELLAAMQKLTGAIQAGNILNSSNREDPPLSAEDILAEVVNPKPNKRKG